MWLLSPCHYHKAIILMLIMLRRNIEPSQRTPVKQFMWGKVSEILHTCLCTEISFSSEVKSLFEISILRTKLTTTELYSYICTWMKKACAARHYLWARETRNNGDLSCVGMLLSDLPCCQIWIHLELSEKNSLGSSLRLICAVSKKKRKNS